MANRSSPLRCGEAPAERNDEAFGFAARLFAGEFEMMMLLTGVGVRQLDRLLATRFPEAAFADALRQIATVARGPKPVAALREMGVTPSLVAPEPNTWRELLAVTEGRPERRIAIQEYGRTNLKLIDALRERGAEPLSVRVYRYALPEDTELLREAARRLAAGEFDITLFTTAVQIEHLARIAGEEGIEAAMLAGLRRTAIASIGPTTTEALGEFDLRPALSQPSTHGAAGARDRRARDRFDARAGMTRRRFFGVVS